MILKIYLMIADMTSIIFIPRSLTNDNNIENNLVLVSKTINQNEKKNDYPVPEKVRTNKKIRDLWHTLHKMGFMNDEKYNRLTSTERLSEEQLAGFICKTVSRNCTGSKRNRRAYEGDAAGNGYCICEGKKCI